MIASTLDCLRLYPLIILTSLIDLLEQLDPLMRLNVPTMVNFGGLKVSITGQSSQTGVIWVTKIVLMQNRILFLPQKQRQTSEFYSAGINRKRSMHQHEFFYSRA